MKNLQISNQQTFVYRPVGLLRIDCSGDHATFRVPWPGDCLHRSGSCRCPNTFRLFGREWRVARWEIDAERTWADMVFSRTLPNVAPADRTWKLRPASIDMAWTALERAVTTSLLQQSNAPVERLRDRDLIPLGLAIAALARLTKPRLHTRDAISLNLTTLRNLETPVIPTYGRIPWRILPQHLRATFLTYQPHSEIRVLLSETFDGFPQEPSDRAHFWRQGLEDLTLLRWP